MYRSLGNGIDLKLGKIGGSIPDEVSEWVWREGVRRAVGKSGNRRIGLWDCGAVVEEDEGKEQRWEER